jgi:hypothetical protein
MTTKLNKLLWDQQSMRKSRRARGHDACSRSKSETKALFLTSKKPKTPISKVIDTIHHNQRFSWGQIFITR